MWIDAGWAQRGLDALRSTLDVDGTTKKAMIEFLFHEGFWDQDKLTWDAAISRFNDCLNPGKPAFFKLGEVWALMKRFERHELFHALAQDLGFEVRRIPTEERRQALLQRVATAIEGFEEELAGARAELARLGPDAQPAVPRDLRHGQAPRFSIDGEYGAGGF